MGLFWSIVLLQPMKEEPPLSIKCKDKFLVQSMFISPENETKNLTDIVSVSPICTARLQT